MRRPPILAALLAFVVCLGPAAVSALACPFCGEANAVDQFRSNAFQFSILFMIGMPMALAAAFGYGFYRLSRQANADVAASRHEPAADPESAANPRPMAVGGAD